LKAFQPEGVAKRLSVLLLSIASLIILSAGGSASASAQPNGTRSQKAVSPRKIQARQQKAPRSMAKVQRKAQNKMFRNSRKKSKRY
jgi:hypothetical protein